MKPKIPHFKERTQNIFLKAAFIQDLGIQLHALEPGRCETGLDLKAKHFQQDQVAHAGVLATLADHTAGGAGATLIGEDETVLTVEFKINLLRPAIGEALRCVGTVLRAGKTLIVAESEVFAAKKGEEKLVAKAMVTLAVVSKR